MTFREALITDIPKMSAIRLAVKENVLSNPALITQKDYEVYLTLRGKGWVCETDGLLVGFAIGDLVKNNVWALFIHPSYEGKGIGKTLLTLLLTWYFDQTNETIWLSTAPQSRAATFYRRFGWRETGTTQSGEIRFELSEEQWAAVNKACHGFKP
jgi:GNAT superfamily N-acetyltransferase